MNRAPRFLTDHLTKQARFLLTQACFRHHRPPGPLPAALSLRGRRVYARPPFPPPVPPNPAA